MRRCMIAFLFNHFDCVPIFNALFALNSFLTTLSSKLIKNCKLKNEHLATLSFIGRSILSTNQLFFWKLSLENKNQAEVIMTAFQRFAIFSKIEYTNIAENY